MHEGANEGWRGKCVNERATHMYVYISNVSMTACMEEQVRGGGINERVKHIMYYVYVSLKNICNTTIFN